MYKKCCKGSCENRKCATGSVFCGNRSKFIGKQNCKKQPKPANVHTDLGFSFSSHATDKHTGLNGVLSSNSKFCTDVKRREADGLANFGELKFALGNKPPVWSLTNQTTGNNRVKVFTRIRELSTMPREDFPFRAEQLEGFKILGVFIGTGVCGTNAEGEPMMRCGEKCYVSGKGCRYSGCTTVAEETNDCVGCKPCCCPAVDTEGAGDVVKSGNLTCCDPALETCECPPRDTDCGGVRLVNLDPTLEDIIFRQTAGAIAGVNTGWSAVYVRPLIEDPVDQNPGSFLGLLQWNSEVRGSRLSQILTGTPVCPVIQTSSESFFSVLSTGIRGNVVLAPEYSSSTVFMRSKIMTVVEAPSQDVVMLVTSDVYIPKSQAIQMLDAVSACSAMQCIFNDELSQPADSCTGRVSSLVEYLDSTDLGGPTRLLINPALYTAANELQVKIKAVIPPYTTTGVWLETVTLELGEYVYDLIFQNILDAPLFTIRWSSSNPGPVPAVSQTSLSFGSEGQLPMNEAQKNSYNLQFPLQVSAEFPIVGGVETCVVLNFFYQTALDFTLPSTAVPPQQYDEFVLVPIVSNGVTFTVDTSAENWTTRLFGSTKIYGFTQFFVGSVNISAESYFNLDVDGDIYRLTFSGTLSGSQEQLFSITDEGTGDLTSFRSQERKDYNLGPLPLQITFGQNVTEHGWFVQMMAVDDGCPLV